MRKIRFYKILTLINLISIFTTFVILTGMLIEGLLAAPMLGGSVGSTGGGGGTYANDWGTDTTNWKKGGIFVVATSDVTSDNSVDILSTNYRQGTFMKYNMIGRAESAGCKQVMMPYTMYAKNYTSSSYDKVRSDGNALISVAMRGTFRNSNNGWDGAMYTIWTDGTNDGLVSKGSIRDNGNNNYRSRRQNSSRYWSMTLNDTSWGNANYGFALVCKK